MNRKEEDNKVSIDGKTGRDILEKEKWTAEHTSCRHTYLAEGLTVIKEAVPLGIDYVFTTICYESSTNFLPLFCYDSSTKKVTIFPLNGNESSTIPR